MKNASGDEDPVPGTSRIRSRMSPPDGMEDALVDVLVERGLLTRSRVAIARRVAFGTAVAAAFAIGVWFGGSSGASPQAAPESRYAFLLYEGSAFEHGDGHREEYIAWAQEFASAGRFVDGEELATESRFVGDRGPGEAPADNLLSGFFIVEASNLDEAISTAEGHPHVRHNGTIEVRPIRNR